MLVGVGIGIAVRLAHVSIVAGEAIAVPGVTLVRVNVIERQRGSRREERGVGKEGGETQGQGGGS